ncbi:hypothetical protein ACJJTC_016368 [Scirpophaga incertulas]
MFASIIVIKENMCSYDSLCVDSAVVSPIEVEPTNDEIEVQAIHTPPIDKELKNDLMTKHVAFENISMLPPKLNPEKVAAVSEPVKKRDLIIAERQKQVGAALAALGMSLQLFLQNGERIEILKNINDAAKILCNTCYSDTMSRRSLISAVIKKDMKESLTGDTDSFLFGSDLSEKIKITKAVQKSVKDLRINASNKPTITPKTKSLNWRAPPRSSARTVTGGRQNLPKQHQKEDRKHRQPFRNIYNDKNNRC